jgi:hypothetical protein
MPVCDRQEYPDSCMRHFSYSVIQLKPLFIYSISRLYKVHDRTDGRYHPLIPSLNKEGAGGWCLTQTGKAIQLARSSIKKL